MREHITRTKVERFLVATAAVFIIIAGLRFAAGIVVQFLLAMFLAIIISKPMNLLKKKGVPAVLAVIIVIVVVLAFGLILVAIIGTSLNDFLDRLPEYQERLQEKLAFFLKWLNKLGFSVADQTVLDFLNPGAAMNLIANMLKGLSKTFSNAFIIFLMTVFLMLEASEIPGKLRKALQKAETSLAAFENFTGKIQRYMIIKTYISLATGICISIFLAIIGLHYFFLFGLLAFILNYIPTIGSILALIPALLIAIIELGFWEVVLVIVAYFAVNTIFGSIIEPRVMGRGVGLSTLVVFLSLIFWGWIFGPVGMLLSVPLTMVLKIALETSEDTRWIAVILGPTGPEPPPKKIREETTK
jgi:predicted PurR-regulated permease PerM